MEREEEEEEVKGEAEKAQPCRRKRNGEEKRRADRNATQEKTR